MTINFFDIHTHLNDVIFNDDREAVLTRMREHGVWGIVIGTDWKSSQDAAMIASFAEDEIFASIGIHPTDVRQERFEPSLFEELAVNKRVVAVGECGLDYSRLIEAPNVADLSGSAVTAVDLPGSAVAEKARQRELFEAQIDFAIAHSLPLMIHCRDSDKTLADAHKDTLALLKEKKNSAGDRLRGNIHFFSQTIEISREYFALGFTISFTGVITFSREYDEVVRVAPLDHIMAETDCPYVAPVPYRGKRNEPIFVEDVVKKIAEIRGEDYETVRKTLVQNALRLFCPKKS